MCGPFGCGKTRTLRECIVLMLRHNPSSRMLICTHSNSAADLYVEDIHKEWTSTYNNIYCIGHYTVCYMISKAVVMYGTC